MISIVIGQSLLVNGTRAQRPTNFSSSSSDRQAARKKTQGLLHPATTSLWSLRNRCLCCGASCLLAPLRPKVAKQLAPQRWSHLGRIIFSKNISLSDIERRLIYARGFKLKRRLT